jgi:hypothetical protein
MYTGLARTHRNSQHHTQNQHKALRCRRGWPGTSMSSSGTTVLWCLLGSQWRARFQSINYIPTSGKWFADIQSVKKGEGVIVEIQEFPPFLEWNVLKMILHFPRLRQWDHYKLDCHAENSNCFDAEWSPFYGRINSPQVGASQLPQILWIQGHSSSYYNLCESGRNQNGDFFHLNTK